ncbi:MAG: glycosyltransferase [Candidatus Gracilibacteria bacterium]|nr:glycosyltransferase [Candidatus Gracilibacteria bacterium]
MTTQTGESIEINKGISQSHYDLRKLFHSEHKNIVYSGALGEKQNPFALIQLFQNLIDANPSIRCHIFSEGPLMEKLKITVDNNYKDKLSFHDLAPEEALNDLYSCSDMQIIPHVLGASDAAFPSKVPNLLQAGVPIVAICDTDSELDTIIKQSGCGLSINTWSSDILVKKILEYLVETSSQSHSQRRIHAQSFIEKHFTLNSLVDTILKSLHEES